MATTSQVPSRVWARRGVLWITTALCFAMVGSHVFAQEPPPSKPSQAQTISDATIPLDNLQVTLRPLTKDELETELIGWLGLLKIKIREVRDTELQLKTLAENELDDTLRGQLVVLRTEETAIAERARTVLDALKAKGGDVQTHEQYINAVSDISETTDVTSFFAAIVA